MPRDCGRGGRGRKTACGFAMRKTACGFAIRKKPLAVSQRPAHWLTHAARTDTPRCALFAFSAAGDRGLLGDVDDRRGSMAPGSRRRALSTAPKRALGCDRRGVDHLRLPHLSRVAAQDVATLAEGPFAARGVGSRGEGPRQRASAGQGVGERREPESRVAVHRRRDRGCADRGGIAFPLTLARMAGIVGAARSPPHAMAARLGFGHSAGVFQFAAVRRHAHPNVQTNSKSLHAR